MPDAGERMAILAQLERGEITPAEAERLLSGQAAAPPKPPAPLTRMGILEQVERGELSADEAAERLGASRRQQAAREPAEEDVTFEPIQDLGAWRYFLGGGLALTIASATGMAYILQRAGMNFWFYCTWLPLAAGIALTAAAWLVRNATWLQMQVRSRKDGRKVFFTLPLPLSVIQRFLDRRGDARIIIGEPRKGGHFHVDL
jgi:hypothetical protein